MTHVHDQILKENSEKIEKVINQVSKNTKMKPKKVEPIINGFFVINPIIAPMHGEETLIELLTGAIKQGLKDGITNPYSFTTMYL